MQRHGRQTKLAEVGEAGQARIVRARIDVTADGLAGEVAARYLAGAGVGHLRVRNERIAAAARSVDPAIEVDVASNFNDAEGDGGEGESLGASPLDLRDPAARALAQGAYLALRALRGALQGPA